VGTVCYGNGKDNGCEIRKENVATVCNCSNERPVSFRERATCTYHQYYLINDLA
jgi:hypothetical protein